MKDVKNQPAMPTAEWQIRGMTLRDYFAAKAMHGAIVGLLPGNTLLGINMVDVAHFARMMSDAMLAEREKQ